MPASPVLGTRERPCSHRIPGLRSALECPNLISSNSFAHRLGTGNSALRLAPGPVGLNVELRHGRMDGRTDVNLCIGLVGARDLRTLWDSRRQEPGPSQKADRARPGTPGCDGARQLLLQRTPTKGSYQQSLFGEFFFILVL